MNYLKFAPAGLLVVVLVAAGCAGRDPGWTVAPTGAPATSGGPVALATPGGPVASASALPTEPVATPAPGTSAAITVKDFTLVPLDLTVVGGSRMVVTNEGPTIHNVKIRDAAGQVLGGTADLPAGASETVSLAAIPIGTYTLFCNLPGHESLGIKGTLTVTK